MWDEIQKRGARWLELKDFVQDPNGPKDPAYAVKLKEYGRSTHFGELYDRYLAAKAELKEAEDLSADPTADADLKILAAETKTSAEASVAELHRALTEMCLTADEDAGRNAMMEIYAGVGGEEAALFVADLYEMYRRYFDRRGWKHTVVDSAPAEMGGFKEVTLRVEGRDVFARLRFEGGGHRVQRVPKTEAQGRIHTSMARVAVLPEVEEVDIRIDPKEIRETFCGAGGPGGQNVNKVATQCQLLHIPTGIMVRCMETRSQLQNKTIAYQLLRAKLYAIEKSKSEANRSNTRLGQIGSGDRSERVRTYNWPQSRCTDHRLEGEDKNWALQDILDGNLDPLVDRLDARRAAELRGEAKVSEEKDDDK
jgi:peptide chain release factor 1